MRADGQTDNNDVANNSFPQLCSAPQKQYFTKSSIELPAKNESLFNPLLIKRNLFNSRAQSVPRSKHCPVRLQKTNHVKYYFLMAGTLIVYHWPMRPMTVKCWNYTINTNFQSQYKSPNGKDWPPLWSSGQSFWLQIQRSRVRFPALPGFLSSCGSGTGSTQPREINRGAIWIKSSGFSPENRD